MPDNSNSDSLVQDYFDLISAALSTIRSQAVTGIDEAAEYCTDAIARQNFAWVFGAGHSSMMAFEAYPRMGGVQGFVPMVEPALLLFQNVVGFAGLEQTLVLERTNGFAEAILNSYDARPGDTILLFSSSGVETLILEMARGARQRGLKTIGITSTAYSREAARQRGLAERLADAADLVIDNQVAVGDACIEVPGLGAKVAPMSSVLGMAIMNAIATATAAKLTERGHPPVVFGSPHLGGKQADAFRTRMDDYRAMFGRRWNRSGGEPG